MTVTRNYLLRVAIGCVVILMATMLYGMNKISTRVERLQLSVAMRAPLDTLSWHVDSLESHLRSLKSDFRDYILGDKPTGEW